MPHGLLWRSMLRIRALQLGRRLLLLEHEVLAHLDDLQRVLDEHRADFLAGAAGRARPQRVLLRRGRRSASACVSSSALVAASCSRANDEVGMRMRVVVAVLACAYVLELATSLLGRRDLVAQRDAIEHLVADVVDELHRRQVLAGVVRGAVVRAARALGARVRVEQALPRELLVPADAPLVLVLEVRASADPSGARERLRAKMFGSAPSRWMCLE